LAEIGKHGFKERLLIPDCIGGLCTHGAGWTTGLQVAVNNFSNGHPLSLQNYTFYLDPVLQQPIIFSPLREPFPCISGDLGFSAAPRQFAIHTNASINHPRAALPVKAFAKALKFQLSLFGLIS
jgi:hypothetical protein